MARRYLPTHEWPNTVTAHGPRELARMVPTTLARSCMYPCSAVGSSVSSGQACLEIESVKSIIDIHAPVTGTIVAVNEAILDQPQLMRTNHH